MKITTKFDINQPIYIKELKIGGKINSIFITRGGLEYNVRYFSGLDYKDCYFREDEMLEKDDRTELGFKQ